MGSLNVFSKVVSNDSDKLILVDADDCVVGHLEKSACHDGTGVLHRAFSIFVFNADGCLLIQQRAAQKRLWPNYWSNSCCSHPRQNESMAFAVQRRCEEELGFRTPLQFVYKFEYSAVFEDVGGEHELCSVYLGSFTGSPRINTTEIQAWRWISPTDVDRSMDSGNVLYTPWFRKEWQRLKKDYSHLIPGTRALEQNPARYEQSAGTSSRRFTSH